VAPVIRRRAPLLAVLAAVLPLAAACGDTPPVAIDTVPDVSGPAGTARPTTTPVTEPEELPTGTIEWRPIGAQLDEGRLDVPLDWDDPDGQTISLYMVRHRANDGQRIGSLLVNPGGPGAAGSPLGEFAEALYGVDLVDQFDIIGWDPRGTGQSEPVIDCGDDYDRWFAVDASPDDPAERDLLVDAAQDLVDGCVAAAGPVLPFVNTMTSARDMDAIRRALGEDTVSYFGFSYGSELGAVWATMFPDTVRAAVLDGAADPTVAYFEQNVQQAAGFEQALTRLLAECSADATCAFHNGGRAEEAYDTLRATLDAQPLTGERTPVNDGVLATAVASALYDQDTWSRLEQALDDAQAGDGGGLLALYDDYYDIDASGSNTSNLIEAYFAIGCLDDPGTTSAAELFDRADELTVAAPRMGPAYQLELMVCALWSERPTERVVISGAGAGPILVVGTTGDTATPLASSRAMADTLEEGRLVVVEGEQHTGYGLNSCIDDIIEGYLVDPARLPAEGTTC
jgi:pimeloyl-ACP methyl ester carboxylesterase